MIKKKKKGITLVEVLVTSLITGFVLTGLGSSLVIGSGIARESYIESSLTNLGNLIQSRIITDIRNGATVNVENLTTGETITGRELTIKARDGSISFIYYAYNNNASLSNRNKIYRQIGAAGSIDEMSYISDAERIGVHWYNAISFIKKTYELESLSIKGIFTHYAESDEKNSSFTNLQIKRFDNILKELVEKENLKLPQYIHVSNSSGLINHHQKSSYTNLSRIGLMLYGYGSKIDFGKKIGKLEPVMSLITEVSYFKVTKENVGISYGLTVKTDVQSRIATLPIGYGDGYNRLLSNIGEVIIRGEKYPIIGTICMDQTMVNLGANGTAYNGDTVLLFGKYKNSEIRLEPLCKKIKTIPYEFLCNINYRVPRKYEN